MRMESASGRTRRADKGAALAANHTLQTIDPPWLPSRVQPALFEVPYCRLIELRREVGIWASVVVADEARNAGDFAGL